MFTAKHPAPAADSAPHIHQPPAPPPPERGSEWYAINAAAADGYDLQYGSAASYADSYSSYESSQRQLFANMEGYATPCASNAASPDLSISGHRVTPPPPPPISPLPPPAKQQDPYSLFANVEVFDALYAPPYGWQQQESLLHRDQQQEPCLQFSYDEQQLRCDSRSRSTDHNGHHEFMASPLLADPLQPGGGSGSSIFGTSHSSSSPLQHLHHTGAGEPVNPWGDGGPAYMPVQHGLPSELLRDLDISANELLAATSNGGQPDYPVPMALPPSTLELGLHVVASSPLLGLGSSGFEQPLFGQFNRTSLSSPTRHAGSKGDGSHGSGRQHHAAYSSMDSSGSTGSLQGRLQLPAEGVFHSPPVSAVTAGKTSDGSSYSSAYPLTCGSYQSADWSSPASNGDNPSPESNKTYASLHHLWPQEQNGACSLTRNASVSQPLAQSYSQTAFAADSALMMPGIFHEQGQDMMVPDVLAKCWQQPVKGHDSTADHTQEGELSDLLQLLRVPL